MSAFGGKADIGQFSGDAQLRRNKVIGRGPRAAKGRGLRLLPTRRPSAAVAAALLIASAFLVLLFSIAGTRAESLLGRCEDAAGVAVLPAPIAPWSGAPLRILVVTEKPTI